MQIFLSGGGLLRVISSERIRFFICQVGYVNRLRRLNNVHQILTYKGITYKPINL